MDFLDQLTSELLADKTDQSVSFYTLEKIETMIRLCSLDKEVLWKRLDKIKDEKEAIEFYNFLLDFQPIPGFHCTPHTVSDQGRAIRFMVAKDDFHELRFK